MFAERIADAVLSSINITDAAAIAAEIDRVKPARILNCAGKTGHPNIDACEKDPEGTYSVNVAGALLLASEAKKRGIHFSHMSSGCVYDGDNAGRGFSEEDAPNFFGSLYARTKIYAESSLRDLQALQFRVRMPMSGVPNARNLLDKLLRYPKIIREANSITIVEDFLPAALELMKRGETGVVNLTNDGVEFHDEVLELYRRYVDAHHRFEVIPYEQLRTQLKAGRSNCILNIGKSKRLGVALPPLSESLPKLMKAYAKNRKSGT